MESIKKIGQNYLNELKERSVKSRVYQSHQLTGLAVAGILDDPKHKSLYMRLAKTQDNEKLLRLAKTVAEGKNIKNKGAYFMKLLKVSETKVNT